MTGGDEARPTHRRLPPRHHVLRRRRLAPPDGTGGLDGPWATLLAHELRTPLTTIRAGLHLLDDGGKRLTKGQRRDVLTTVRGETERLVRTIDDLVAVTQPDEPNGVREPIMIQHLLGPIAARHAIDAGPTRIAVSVDPAIPPIRGDADDVRRILDNLIDAAVAAGPPDGLVEVTVSQGRDDVIIRITRRAVRPTHTPTAPRTMLGIAAARRIADAMGAKVRTRPARPDGIELELAVPAEVSLD